MKAVIIGDIGWRYLYHLGDEAMTEAAITQLSGRGVEDITLVAAEPQVATTMYGYPAVPRVGFLGKWGRARNERVLESVTSGIRDGAEAPDLHRAIRNCDVAIIAGGGNMNSEHVHHLYERVAFKRIAEYYSKPLYVTSQTVGPMLRAADAEYVRELVDYAVCFGSRERTTYDLVRDLASDPTRVVLTADDASLLRADDESRAWVHESGLGQRWIAASFTAHPGTSGLSELEYVERTACLLDQLARDNDASVALAPHVGSLDRSITKGDQSRNIEIVAASRSGRVVALPMLTARQDVALIEQSILSVSTRYHPAVFGPAAAVPTASISLSYYSSVRMRGALRHVGMQDYVIPATSWRLASAAMNELIANSDGFDEHLREGSVMVRTYQGTWWDSIVDGAITGVWKSPGNINASPRLRPEGSWSGIVRELTPVFELFGQEKVWSKWFHEDGATLRRTVDALSRELEASKLHGDELYFRLENVIAERDAVGRAYAGTVGQRVRRRVDALRRRGPADS